MIKIILFLGCLLSHAESLTLDKLMQDSDKQIDEQFYKKGLDLIKGSSSTYNNESRFLVMLANSENTKIVKEKQFAEIFSYLKIKYKDDKLKLLKVIVKEAEFYKDVLLDFQKYQLLLEVALIMEAELKCESAILYCNLQFNYAESLLGKDELKMKIHLMNVINFPIYKEPYFQNRKAHKQLMEIYLKAAMRLVEKTEPRDLKFVRLHAFAYRELVKRHNDKVQYLSTDPMGIIELKKKIIVWLEISIKREKDKALKASFTAVLNHIKAK